MEPVDQTENSTVESQASEHQPALRPAGADRSELPGPVMLAIIALVAGPMIAGPMIGRTLHRLGHRMWGWLSGVTLALLGLGLNIGLLVGRMEQFWATLTLFSVHTLLAGATLPVMTRVHRRGAGARAGGRPPRGTHRHIVTGAFGGLLICSLLGVAVVSVYMLISDRLFSTLMPVAFDDGYTLFLLFMSMTPVLIAFVVSGGIMGWLRPRTTPARMLGYAAALLWAQLTWLVALQITIGIPGFQAGAATGQGWRAMQVTFITGQFLVGIGWSIALLIYVTRPVLWQAAFRRALWVPIINLGAAVALAIGLGYSADLFLAMGRHQEREAHTARALWCYQLGLTKAPSSGIASYLQYRAALIHHKLGHREQARDGFRRVVTKYNEQESLAQKAGRFLDNLENPDTTGKRVVLPGVETRTQYTGAYCVPNSLALAMRYWGADVDARRIGAKITGLGTGTYVVDQTWYARQHDFRHDFLTLATPDDIKTAIDAGFPVLVYIPMHVFAIVGYDEALATFVTYDVATQDLWVEYLQKDFIKAWKKQATTLVLVYPEEKARLVPEQLQTRISRSSDNYLHFQLHYFRTFAGSPRIAHLSKAAGDSGDFFFPLTLLYAQYPHLRATLDRRFDMDHAARAIDDYFGNDFDEGIHMPGQYHNERWADPDWALRTSVQYLIGHGRFQQAEQLLARVNDEGRLSGGMQYYQAMIALNQGRYADALDRFSRASEKTRSFYTALASLQTGERPHALKGLVETLDGCRCRFSRRSADSPNDFRDSCRYYDDFEERRFIDKKYFLDMDDMGFPVIALTNSLLVRQKDFGENREALEEQWQNWLQHTPYDAPVARRLAELYADNLARRTPKKASGAIRRLTRKLHLARSRARRYDPSAFAPSTVPETETAP